MEIDDSVLKLLMDGIQGEQPHWVVGPGMNSRHQHDPEERFNAVLCFHAKEWTPPRCGRTNLTLVDRIVKLCILQWLFPVWGQFPLYYVY